MKQIAAILFSLFYLVSVTGLPVTVHYCKGDFVSISFLSDGEECCCTDKVEVKSCCAEERPEETCQVSMEDECCSFDDLFVQFDEDNQTSKGLTSSSNSGKEKVLFMESLILQDNTLESEEIHGYLNLPPPGSRPLWLFHCSLTFYG